MLHLDTAGARAVASAQKALLSPLRHETAEEWQAKANQAVLRAIGADRAVFSYPTAGDPLGLVTTNTPPAFTAGMRRYWTGVAEGDVLFHDAFMERAGRIRRAMGAAAYHLRQFETEGPVGDSPAYEDVFAPAGLRFMVGLSVPRPVGEITQFVGFDRADAEGYGESGMTRLRMLVPAFIAGTEMRLRYARTRETLLSIVDRLPHPLLLFSPEGELLHANGAFGDLATGDAEARVLGAAELFARQLLSTFRTPEAGVAELGRRKVRVASRCYALSASLLPGGFLDGGLLVQVDAEHPVAGGADPKSRARMLGLTARQADVACRMAAGLSDKAIARELGLSVSTVRNHAAAVRRRLEVPNRAAVAARLIDRRS